MMMDLYSLPEHGSIKRGVLCCFQHSKQKNLKIIGLSQLERNIILHNVIFIGTGYKIFYFYADV